MPRVSVILTSFNHEKFICEAIDSVLNQTFTDFELIIWDDASSDNSWYLINQYTDSRIKVFRNDVQKRGIWGINKAISEVAAGEYIAIHHSDDVWELTKLEKQVAFLDANQDIGAVFTNAQIIDEQGKAVQNDCFIQKNKSRWQWLRELFTGENHLNHPSLLIRKQCYQDVGVYRYGLAQTGDAEMWSRILLKFPIHVIQKRLTKHRQFTDKSNTSGDRIDTAIRVSNEWNIIRENYLAITDFEELVAIFPSLERYRNPAGFDNKFLLAMACLYECKQKNAWQLGLTWLFELLNDSVRYPKITKLYAFSYTDLIKLTAEFDVYFSEWERHEKDIIQECALEELRLYEVIIVKDEIINNQAEEIARLYDVLEVKEVAVSDQSEEIARLYDVLEVKEVAVNDQAEEIARLYDVLELKEVAVSDQAEEIARLYDVLELKEVAVSEQAEEITRLYGVLELKEVAVSDQSEEITRLYGVLEMKDAAMTNQAQGIQRLDEMLIVKDATLIDQAQEIHRLNEVLIAKDAAVIAQAQEIHCLNEVLIAKDAAMTNQAQEIHSLNEMLVAKDAAITNQAQEIHCLNEVLIAKDTAMTDYQVQEIHSLNEVIIAKDAAMTNQAQEIHCLNEVLIAKDAAMINHAQEIHCLNEMLKIHCLNEVSIEKDNAITNHQAEEIHRLNEMLTEKDNTINCLESELLKIQQSKWYRLENALKTRPMTLHSFVRIAYLSAGLITPMSLRTKFAPIISKLRQRRLNTPPSSIEKIVESSAYLVKLPETVAPVRQHIVHIIANFMTGGSSRLVVDLIENLSYEYSQAVLTSFIPDPPAYGGLDIEECRFATDETPFVEYFQRTQPDFIHVHYWGDCDEPWYAKAIEAARQLGIPVIENINTPIAPYISDAVVRYVYVSDYVRHVFGQEDAHHITIYPGSDFSHFNRELDEKIPDDCVGMVYRLENDKLNEQSIIPFIKIAQRRPQTRVLIVGGGSLLEPFQQAVEAAGVKDCFEFTGYVSYESLPDLYRRMSVFITPVWKESFGQVSPFAMNMRVPVIGYDVGAIGEIIDNSQLLASAANTEELADIAINLLDSPEFREHIGCQQASRAQNFFSVQAMIESYSKLYAEISHTKKSNSL